MWEEQRPRPWREIPWAQATAVRAKGYLGEFAAPSHFSPDLRKPGSQRVETLTQVCARDTCRRGVYHVPLWARHHAFIVLLQPLCPPCDGDVIPI